MKSNKKKLMILTLVSIVAVLFYLFWGLNEQNFNYNLNKRIPKVIAIVLQVEQYQSLQ